MPRPACRVPIARTMVSIPWNPGDKEPVWKMVLPETSTSAVCVGGSWFIAGISALRAASLGPWGAFGPCDPSPELRHGWWKGGKSPDYSHQWLVLDLLRPLLRPLSCCLCDNCSRHIRLLVSVPPPPPEGSLGMTGGVWRLRLSDLGDGPRTLVSVFLWPDFISRVVSLSTPAD